MLAGGCCDALRAVIESTPTYNRSRSTGHEDQDHATRPRTVTTTYCPGARRLRGRWYSGAGASPDGQLRPRWLLSAGNAYVPGPVDVSHFSNSMRLRIQARGHESVQARSPRWPCTKPCTWPAPSNKDMTAESVGLHDGGAVAEHLQLRVKESRPRSPIPSFGRRGAALSRLEHAQSHARS